MITETIPSWMYVVKVSDVYNLIHLIILGLIFVWIDRGIRKGAVVFFGIACVSLVLHSLEDHGVFGANTVMVSWALISAISLYMAVSLATLCKHSRYRQWHSQYVWPKSKNMKDQYNGEA